MKERDVNRLELLCKTFLADSADTGHLLKVHLFTERLLDELILDCLGSKSEMISRLDLRYTQKISLAESLAVLPPECATSLRRLNALRNACVHTLHMTPEIEQVRNIMAGFADELPAIERETTVEELLNRYLSFLCGYLFPGAIKNIIAEPEVGEHGD